MMYTSWEGKEEVGGEWEGEGGGSRRREEVGGEGEGRKEGVGGERKGTLWSRGERFQFNDCIYCTASQIYPGWLTQGAIDLRHEGLEHRVIQPC